MSNENDSFAMLLQQIISVKTPHERQYLRHIFCFEIEKCFKSWLSCVPPPAWWDTPETYSLVQFKTGNIYSIYIFHTYQYCPGVIAPSAAHVRLLSWHVMMQSPHVTRLMSTSTGDPDTAHSVLIPETKCIFQYPHFVLNFSSIFFVVPFKKRHSW